MILLNYHYYWLKTNKWSNKWFRSCDRNFDFFRDLILMEVSELNGIVWFIVRLVCKQFGSCKCAFEIRT